MVLVVAVALGELPGDTAVHMSQYDRRAEQGARAVAGQRVVGPRVDVERVALSVDLVGTIAPVLASASA